MYRYTVDGIIFKSQEEINQFLEKQALDSFKFACKEFNEYGNMESSIYASKRAEDLVNKFGYTWEQIEEIEISLIA